MVITLLQSRFHTAFSLIHRNYSRFFDCSTIVSAMTDRWLVRIKCTFHISYIYKKITLFTIFNIYFLIFRSPSILLTNLSGFLLLFLFLFTCSKDRRKATMVATMPGHLKLGQRRGLTETDCLKINELYQCLDDPRGGRKYYSLCKVLSV